MKLPKLSRKEDEQLSNSPLLNNDAGGSRLNSTIHPERFDMSRFSEKYEEEESSYKVILYVIAVIVIGVGLALFIRYLIQRNEQTAANQPEQKQENEDKAIEFNLVAAPDTDVSDAPKNSELKDTKDTKFGVKPEEGDTATLNKINYQKYTSFARTTFTFEDDNKVLESNLNFADNKITLTFNDNVLFNSEFDLTTTINDTVSDITVIPAEKQIILQLNGPAKYKISVKDNTFFIDLKTQAQIDLEAQTPETPTDTGSEEPTEEVDPNKPKGVNLTNEFSRKKQYVTSNVTGNTIPYNEIFFEDTVNYFEIAWGSRNNVGEKFVPNATAELKKEDGKIYIEVIVNNLSTAGFKNLYDSSNIPVGLSGANFKSSTVSSFKNGTLILMIEIKKEADYRLVSEPTVSGATQVLSLQIKD